MKSFGNKNFNKPYSVSAQTDKNGGCTSENCADLAGKIANAGQVSATFPQSAQPPLGSLYGVKGPYTNPNEQYKNFTNDNKGTAITPHVDQ